MQATSNPDINILLDFLLSRIQSILGKKLVGFYLYGSLVSGDFETGSSDIDLLAATSNDIDEEDFDNLQKMHNDFANKHEEWDDRIEVAYLSVAALQTVKSQTVRLQLSVQVNHFMSKIQEKIGY